MLVLPAMNLRCVQLKMRSTECSTGLHVFVSCKGSVKDCYICTSIAESFIVI